jgi:transcriptional regulator with PAS, ATPase and Fis domain
MEEKREEGKGELKEFRENPYDPEARKPEDVVRIFYMNNVPIVPVVSHRGILLGILRKDDVVAELSDIERASRSSIDTFITGLARKMPLDEVLTYVTKTREFVTINLFGEIQGTWSRLQLLAACESPRGAESMAADAAQDREKQAMEWMIYLILEHLPRALYALNERGSTIFYNSHFEELFEAALKREVDTAFVEKTLADAEKNEVHTRDDGSNEPYFYNNDMRLYYEKIPMTSAGRSVGYLIYCGRDLNAPAAGKAARGGKKQTLAERLETTERAAIVGAFEKCGGDAAKAAGELGISRAALSARMKKLGIETGAGKARRPKK